MKKADYTKIAKVYDQNQVRLQIPTDARLADIASERPHACLNILDLGCGTGNYLRVQAQAFADKTIQCFGLDASRAMLALAQQKAPAAVLIEGDAACLPYHDRCFDYVMIHFAFHHFKAKAQAIKEVQRVLKSSGVVKMVNIVPWEMQHWWLYRYFPACYALDQERFWTTEQLFTTLEEQGFAVTCTISKSVFRITLEEIYAQAQNRDISQLDVLENNLYQDGLQQIQQDIAHGETAILDESALIELIGRKE